MGWDKMAMQRTTFSVLRHLSGKYVGSPTIILHFAYASLPSSPTDTTPHAWCVCVCVRERERARETDHAWFV